MRKCTIQVVVATLVLLIVMNAIMSSSSICEFVSPPHLLAPYHSGESQFLPEECRDFLVNEFPSLTLLAEQGKGASMGSEGGAWSACTHIAEYGVNFAVFFARHLAYGLRPKTVLEFGCGLGTTSDFLARFVPGGSQVICVEPEPMLGEVFGNEQLKPFPQRPLQLAMNTFAPESSKCAHKLFTPDMRFELVLSLEVAEHIPLVHHDDLILLLSAATSKYLVFSAARPNQGGIGHIDESMHDRSWWIEKFASVGNLHYLPQLSLGLRFMTGWSERAYDFGTNLIAFGAPGVADVAEIPRVAHDCFFFPHPRDHAEGDETEKKHAQRHNMTAKLEIQNCPDPEGLKVDTRQTRELWVEGQTQALWPELDLLIRRVWSGEIKCNA